MDVPIVVVAFSRPDSLKRLLNSIAVATFPVGVKIYISIDGGGPSEAIAVANEFEWNFGEKEIIIHKRNLGLKEHILACTNLVSSHDGIVVLEDDLLVAPGFYTYSLQALQYYYNDSNVAGVSLYAHCFNETAEMPFIPIDDGHSVFFMQLASSWGQCFSKEQWGTFTRWYRDYNSQNLKDEKTLPANIQKWPDSSWKKHFIRYMVQLDLYFVYPRTSYTTNFADKGVNQRGDNHFQVPLNLGKPSIEFIPLMQSAAKYDSYCELLPACLFSLKPEFAKYELVIDLYGQKPLKEVNGKYLLSSRPTDMPLLSFGRKMFPHEMNIINNIAGNDIHLAPCDSFKTPPLGFNSANMVYFHRMPGWHKKTRRDASLTNGNLSEKEEELLRIFSKPVYKPFFILLLAFHRLAGFIRQKLF